MKKYLVILIIFLVGCSNNNQIENGNEPTVVMTDSGFVNSVTVNESVYVSIEALPELNIDVLKDEMSNTVYLVEFENENKVSNNRSYNWYVDQGNTGTFAGDNCGPSASVMAAKWQDESFDNSAEDARVEFRSSGGWWYTDDVKGFFEKHNIIFDVDEYDGTFELVNTLEEGNIVLLCLDTSYIEEKDDRDSYIGRFYNYSGGHFLVVKGYVYIDGELFFEVYDSNCWGETYSDGSPKGKNRLYPGEDIDDAIEEWWDYYFIIDNI